MLKIEEVQMMLKKMLKNLSKSNLVDYNARCPFCGDLNIIKVPEESLQAYNNGVLAQNAFPNLTAAEREMIITGICPKCWDYYFGKADKN